MRRSTVRFSSDDHFIVGVNGNDSGAVRYSATLPVAGLMYAWSPQLHLYAAVGRGFETPTFNELAYRPDGTAGLNFALRPSRSDNIELGVKGQTQVGERFKTRMECRLFQTSTQDEIVTQTNVGGRSTFQNAGATRRRGLELSWSAALAPAWQFQLSQSWLDARYRDAFAACNVIPCAVANQFIIPAGNRIPGTANRCRQRGSRGAPPRGWRAGAELRRSSRVFVNDTNTEAAPSFTTVAVSAGYVFDVRGWALSANARDRQPAGPSLRGCR